MPKGPKNKRPLPIILQELAFSVPGLVLVQGSRAYQIERESRRARREAKSGHPGVQAYLSEHRFWWDEDPDGKIVIWREEPQGPQVHAAEHGSRYTAWTLEHEGDGGTEMVLSGPSFEVLDPFKGASLEGTVRRLNPEFRIMREGFYRAIQRVHRGIPGLKGTGQVFDDHFNGGLTDVRTAWPVKPHGTGIPDAVPIAGFYCFGHFWAKMIEVMGLPDNMSDIARVLQKEFGILSDEDLERGTVPIPKAR